MHPMLTIAVRAARRGGTIIQRARSRLHEIDFDKKGKQDYVSQIDRDSEIAVIDTLLAAFPRHAIKAEESGEQGDSDHVWIIDPLDGTLNFLHGYPQFTISIALKIKGRLDQAVVYDPILDELFTASRGMGAQLNGQKIRAASRSNLSHCLLATGFPVRTPEAITGCLTSFSKVLPKCSDIRRGGAASLDLAYVACGRLDGYWESGLKEWDVAAGSLLVQESGGLVGDLSGAEKHLDSGNIIAANPRIYKQLLPLIKTG